MVANPGALFRVLRPRSEAGDLADPAPSRGGESKKSFRVGVVPDARDFYCLGRLRPPTGNQQRLRPFGSCNFTTRGLLFGLGRRTAAAEN